MKKPIILCVDDEKVVLTSLKAQLKRHFGDEYLIETAENGIDAFEFVNEIIEQGDELPVVISDHIMPGMKGDELLINIHNKLPKTLSIMLTGQADAVAVGNALNNAKLYRYISKPWEETDLKMTIVEALRSFFQDQKIEDQNKELEEMVIQLKEYNENLEEKVKERTALIQQQNDEITFQHHILSKQKEHITDSIVYASLIQQALLPSREILKANFPEHFIIFKPRDIVSGDFYWFKQVDHSVYIAVADCTGHGVPGAFMGTLGISLLNDVLNKPTIKSTDIVLEELRVRMKGSLHQGRTQDGMDLALCLVDIDTKKMQFSGANLHLHMISNNQFTEYKGERMPIGNYPKDYKQFGKHEIQLQKGDTFYISSDGFSSQFGGEKSFKYSTKRFHEALINIHNYNMETQKRILEKSLSEWQGNHDQVDDILVIGIKID